MEITEIAAGCPCDVHSERDTTKLASEFFSNPPRPGQDFTPSSSPSPSLRSLCGPCYVVLQCI